MAAEVDPVLETARLVLRPLRAGDAPELATLLEASRAHLEPWLGVGDADGWIARFASGRASGDGHGFGMFDRPGGALVGCVALERLGPSAWALACWVAAERSGQGLASEALPALMRHGVAALGARRFEIRCAPANRRSVAVAERLGFAPAGTIGAELRFALEPPAPRLAWADVRLHLAGRHQGLRDEGATLTLPGRFAVAGRGQVEQRIVIEVGEAAGEAWLLVCAPVAPEAALPAHALLRHNSGLAYGALCIIGDLVVMRAALPLGALTLQQLDRAIHLVGQEAATLRARTRRSTQNVVTLFAGYA